MLTEIAIDFDLCHWEDMPVRPWYEHVDVPNGTATFSAIDDEFMDPMQRWSSYYDCGGVELNIQNFAFGSGASSDDLGFFRFQCYRGIYGSAGQWETILNPYPADDPERYLTLRPMLSSRRPWVYAPWSLTRHTAAITYTGDTVQISLDGNVLNEIAASRLPWGVQRFAQWKVNGLARIYETRVAFSDGRVKTWDWSDEKQILDWSSASEVGYGSWEKEHNTVKNLLVDHPYSLEEYYDYYSGKPFIRLADGYISNNNWHRSAQGAIGNIGTDGPHAILDAAGRTKKAYADTRAVMFKRIEYFHDASSWSAPVTIHTGGYTSAPCLIACDDGTLGCWYMSGGGQHASRSSDDGRTWQEITNMLGATLKNVYCINVRGTIYGVGVRDKNAYLVRSNDHGVTQTPFPGGAMEIPIGAVSYDMRCCITYEETGEMVCWAQDDEGKQIQFYSRGSGYTVWTRRAVA